MNIILLLYFCIIFLQQLSTSCCDHNDVKTKKINNATKSRYMDFMLSGVVGHLSKLEEHLLNDSYQDTIVVDIPELTKQINEEQLIEKDNPVQPHREDYDDYVVSNEINHVTIENTIPDKGNDCVDDIRKFVSVNGKRKLKLLGYEIKSQLNLTHNISSILHDMDSIYIAKLEGYFNLTRGKVFLYDIDREFVIFDLITSTNLIFDNISRMLYNSIISKSRVSLNQTNVKMLRKTTQNAVFDNKKEGFKYICRNKYICRPLPAYSDHVVELLKEVLLLPEKKFMLTVKMLREILGKHAELLKTLLDDDISSEIKHISDSFPEISENLYIAIQIITWKFEMFRSFKIEINNSTKAVRILIDLIDRTFEIFGDKYLNSEFIKVRKGINFWVHGKRDSTYKMWKDFCDKAVNVVKHYWNQETREEVKVLIEIIMNGASKNKFVSDYLLTKGSNFVKGDAAIYSDDDVV